MERCKDAAIESRRIVAGEKRRKWFSRGGQNENQVHRKQLNTLNDRAMREP